MTDDLLDEPCSSQDLVNAFNKRDEEAVRKTLEENPGALHQTCFWWIKEVKGSYLPEMSAAEAAVHMGWAKVLPVLHAAGDRFDKPRGVGALHMATGNQKSSCVRMLLKLGASFEKNEHGLAPIARLKPKFSTFEKNKTIHRIGQAYIKAGQDPWQDTGRGLAAIYLLKNSAPGVVIDMLAEQVKQGKRASKGVEASHFWEALIEGITPLFAHFHVLPVESHIKPWCKLVELAKQVGLAADEKSMTLFLQVAINKMDDSTLSLSHRNRLMTAFTRTGIAMAQAMPDPIKGLASLLETVEPHSRWVEPALLAQCRNDLMQSDTPAANKPAGRASRRF